MTLQETFQQAVADSKLLTSRPDNDTLLKLYSLYKQATEGDAPDEGPSNPFDFIAKAKHTAWSEIQGTTKDDAMNQYVALVESLKK
jgi:diazepam-binding inhibitor (GABA receptor modulator, acyl-CoA-binding protein)